MSFESSQTIPRISKFRIQQDASATMQTALEKRQKRKSVGRHSKAASYDRRSTYAPNNIPRLSMLTPEQRKKAFEPRRSARKSAIDDDDDSHPRMSSITEDQMRTRIESIKSLTSRSQIEIKRESSKISPPLDPIVEVPMVREHQPSEFLIGETILGPKPKRSTAYETLEESVKPQRKKQIFNIYNRPRPQLIQQVLQPETRDADIFFDSNLKSAESAAIATEPSLTSTIVQEEIVPEPDFFALLRSIPEIEELSGYNIRLSDELFQYPSKESTLIEGSVGEEEYDYEYESEIEEEIDDNADLLFLLREDDRDKADELLKEESGFEQFTTFVEEGKKRIKIDESLAAEDREAKKMLIRETDNFLSRLINSVVANCEYMDPTKILRNNLEKKQLMIELINRLKHREDAQKARAFLNRRTVEHFRRKKAFRSITFDDPDTLALEMQKYNRAIEQLDLLLGKESDLKRMKGQKLKNGLQEIALVRRETKQEVEELEELIRQTVIRDEVRMTAKLAAVTELETEKSTKSGKNPIKGEKAKRAQKYIELIEKHIIRLAKVREEISSVRFKVILRQNTLATLRIQLDRVEDLGNGLHIREYENLQTEVVAIDSKITERDTELNKYRNRCTTAVAVMAHLREKREMMKNTLTVQKNALASMYEEKQDMRNYLYKLKSKHKRVREDVKELSFQGGLLDKPALMKDYDQTVDKIEDRREKVEQLKLRNQELLDKIKVAERKCGIRYSWV